MDKKTVTFSQFCETDLYFSSDPTSPTNFVIDKYTKFSAKLEILGQKLYDYNGSYNEEFLFVTN